MSVWVLILIAAIDRGGASVSIPVKSKVACVQAVANWKELKKRERLNMENGRYAYCLNTTTGEMR